MPVRRQFSKARATVFTLDLLNRAVVLGPNGLTEDERRVIAEQDPRLAESLSEWTDPALDDDPRRHHDIRT